MRGSSDYSRSVRRRLGKIETVRANLREFDKFEALEAKERDTLCRRVADKLTPSGCEKRGVVVEEAKFYIKEVSLNGGLNKHYY